MRQKQTQLYTEKLKNLANELKYDLPTETISLREALTNVCEAWKAKGVIEREDGAIAEPNGLKHLQVQKRKNQEGTLKSHMQI